MSSLNEKTTIAEPGSEHDVPLANRYWHEICAAEDIVPGTGVAAKLQGWQVAVFNTPQGFFAIANHDPFSGANVLSRGIVGDIGGTLVVASPVYKQHFCLRTGECIEDRDVVVPVWPVKLEKGRVLIGSGVV
jgi:nitrite reductase (NADH) small subunit